MKKILSTLLFGLALGFVASPNLAEAGRDCRKGECYVGSECRSCKRLSDTECLSALNSSHSKPYIQNNLRRCGGKFYAKVGGSWKKVLAKAPIHHVRTKIAYGLANALKRNKNRIKRLTAQLRRLKRARMQLLRKNHSLRKRLKRTLPTLQPKDKAKIRALIRD